MVYLLFQMSLKTFRCFNLSLEIWILEFSKNEKAMVSRLYSAQWSEEVAKPIKQYSKIDTA